MSRFTRIALVSGGAVLLAALLCVWLAAGRREPDHSAEILVPDPGKSYGCGNVAVSAPDRVNFRFDYRGGRARVFYAAGGVEAVTELEVLVNGEPAGYVEPTLGGWVRGLRLKLPTSALVPGVNVLTFDNTLNPPGRERWGVAQVRIEEEVLPAQDARRARELHELGKAAFEARSVAPANLSRAIEYFDEAESYVEGTDPPPPLLETIRRSEQEAQDALDRVVRDYTFAAAKRLRFGDRKGALRTLRRLLRFLPDREDPRREKVSSRLREIGGRDFDLE